MGPASMLSRPRVGACAPASSRAIPLFLIRSTSATSFKDQRSIRRFRPVAQLSIGKDVVLDDTGRDPLAGNAQLPLLGKRILLTGARPMWVPGVCITRLDADTAEADLFDQALHELIAQAASNSHNSGHGNGSSSSSSSSSPKARPYTHVAFTSKNGIHATIQRLADLTGGLGGAVDVLIGSGARLCALGVDGEVLKSVGCPLHVSPKEASTQGLVKELEARGEARGARVLCPVPHVTGGLTEPSVVPRFLAALEAAGAEAVRIPSYVTAMGCDPGSCQGEKEALQQGHVHAIAFSSTAEAQGLVAVMGGREALRESIQRHSVLLAAHGPYTAAGAGEVLGLPVTCVSKQFSSFDGLVQALEDHFASAPSSLASSAEIDGLRAGASMGMAGAVRL